MTLLACLRHGETAWSAAGRIQGRADIPLNEAGRADLRGRKLPLTCRGMRVVTSPLLRCVESAVLLGSPDAIHESRIVEMDWGEWQGELLADLRLRLGEAMRDNEARGLDFMPPGGESPREVIARVRTWLSQIAEPTLAITHRGVIRAIIADACGWDMRGPPPARLDWNAVHLFDIDPPGRPRVQQLNLK
ncbi:MAG: histidine phosphatase family protein [Pseudomonadota bacterium]|nr:histidine phosphatase family protein [Pseudomonadota bacterium]